MMENYENQAMGLGFGIGGLVYVAVIVVTIIGLWKMFEKAGKPGWAAIVPIYNGIVMAEIVGKPAWWGVLLIVPCVGIVFGIWLLNLFMKSFGKDTLFTILALLFPFVIFPMLGFGDDKYIGPVASEAGGRDTF